LAVHFAVDFGTTNTVVAADSAGSVVPLALEGVMAERTGTPVVPSAVYFPESGGAPTIGEEAVNHNLLGLGRRPSFAQGFKRHLGAGSFRPVASLNREPVSARRAGQAYFDGLRRALRRQLRPRRRGVLGFWDDFQERRQPLVGDLTLAAPVEAAEHSRRELVSRGRRLGARNSRLAEEPLAAALGYGVNVGRELTLLVLDWGGGTLDVCVVRTGPTFTP
jgi:molecular chaperone DnaK (HSP70)